eukprot:6482800-Amphidinium_carterae.3
MPNFSITAVCMSPTTVDSSTLKVKALTLPFSRKTMANPRRKGRGSAWCAALLRKAGISRMGKVAAAFLRWNAVKSSVRLGSGCAPDTCCAVVPEELGCWPGPAEGGISAGPLPRTLQLSVLLELAGGCESLTT